jgi:hypothetical protein
MKLKTNFILNLIVAAFIFLFTYTAISKIVSHELFRNTLDRSPLIGNYATLLSIALPVTELVVAGLLFFRRLTLAGLYSSFLLMSVFTLYLTYMILFDEELPCSCGGVLQQMSWQQHLWFDIFLTGLAGWGIYLHRRQFSSTISSFA